MCATAWWLLKERATGFEPVTSSLGSWHSTPELRPQNWAECARTFRPRQLRLFLVAPGDDAVAARVHLDRRTLLGLNGRQRHILRRHDRALVVEKLEHEVQRLTRRRARIGDQAAQIPAAF